MKVKSNKELNMADGLKIKKLLKEKRWQVNKRNNTNSTCCNDGVTL